MPRPRTILPASGEEIGMNTIQTFFGLGSETERELSELGEQIGIADGSSVSLSDFNNKRLQLLILNARGSLWDFS